MLELFTLILVSVAVQGHNGKVQDEAALQTELMPQELNSDFVPAKDTPWKVVMPRRLRRDAYDTPKPEYSLDRVKAYSRVVACVVLALSAAVEIIVYLVEMYSAAS